MAVHVADQKGEAWRVKIVDTQGGFASPGESIAFYGLSLKAKPIRGGFDKLLTSGAKK